MQIAKVWDLLQGEENGSVKQTKTDLPENNTNNKRLDWLSRVSEPASICSESNALEFTLFSPESTMESFLFFLF